MKLKIEEQKELSPAFDVQKIFNRLNPWEKVEPSRSSVKKALQEIFPDAPIFIGGHHVAVHNPITGNRMLLITGTSVDFS